MAKADMPHNKNSIGLINQVDTAAVSESYLPWKVVLLRLQTDIRFWFYSQHLQLSKNESDCLDVNEGIGMILLEYTQVCKDLQAPSEVIIWEKLRLTFLYD